jgi:hypothetical protein
MHGDRRTPNWVRFGAVAAAALVLLVILIHLSGIEIPGIPSAGARRPQ